MVCNRDGSSRPNIALARVTPVSVHTVVLLSEKEPAEVALHIAHGVLDQSLQLSDMVFNLTIYGRVIGSRFKGLGTVSFVECSDIVRHKRFAIVRHQPLRNTKHHKKQTQHTDDRCRSRMSHLLNFESLGVHVDEDQEVAALHWFSKVNMEHVPGLWDSGSMGQRNFGWRSLYQLAGMPAARCLLDLLVNLVTPHVTPGTVLHRDDTTMTCMCQCHGLCTSSDKSEDSDDTVSPRDASMEDDEL